MAITTTKLYMESDNLVRLVSLKNTQTGAYIDDATPVTMSLFEGEDDRKVITAVTNNEDGTVDLTIVGHGCSANDYVYVLGTKNYNDKYLVSAAATADKITITATYVAETFTSDSYCHRYIPNGRAIALTYKAVQQIKAAAAVQNTDDTTLVKIPCDTNGFAVGDIVTITGTTSYNGTFTVMAAEENYVSIKVTYVAETFTGAETITARGIYEGVLPETIVALIADNKYYLFVFITKGTSVLTLRRTVKAVYHSGIS